MPTTLEYIAISGVIAFGILWSIGINAPQAVRFAPTVVDKDAGTQNGTVQNDGTRSAERDAISRIALINSQVQVGKPAAAGDLDGLGQDLEVLQRAGGPVPVTTAIQGFILTYNSTQLDPRKAVDLQAGAATGALTGHLAAPQ